MNKRMNELRNVMIFKMLVNQIQFDENKTFRNR